MTYAARIARTVCGSVLFALLAGGVALAQQAPATRLAGDLVSVEGNRITVRAPSGETNVITLADNTRVLLTSAITADQIKPNAFIAVTAPVQPDGTLLAIRVNVFPEVMRGSNEGHYPLPGSTVNTMTNATVASMSNQPQSANTMTNATVASVSGTGSRSVKLTYKGGEKTAIIPANLPITLLEEGNRSVLVPGVKVGIGARRGPDGGWVAATSLQVGKNGSTPPN